jgi:hypothetical protein
VGWWLPTSGRAAECITFRGCCRAGPASADRPGRRPSGRERAGRRGTCERCRDWGIRDLQFAWGPASRAKTQSTTTGVLRGHDRPEVREAGKRDASPYQPFLTSRTMNRLRDTTRVEDSETEFEGNADGACSKPEDLNRQPEWAGMIETIPDATLTLCKCQGACLASLIFKSDLHLAVPGTIRPKHTAGTFLRGLRTPSRCCDPACRGTGCVSGWDGAVDNGLF